MSLDERQRRIRGRALELGVELTKTFIEEGVSGSTPLYRRPQGEKLLAAVRPGDTVIAAKLDRVFRSALDALQVIEDFRRAISGSSCWTWATCRATVSRIS